jgi:ubiquinone/menaquinone biosynthesis C-methylase UbiE
LSEQHLYNPASIRALFNEMARTYGAVNLISSLGFAVRWRHQCIGRLPPAAPLRRVADLMSGMGELWRSISHRIGADTQVVAVDISEEMARRGPRTPPCVVSVRVEDALLFRDQAGSFDAVVSSFGLKTLNPQQQDQLAAQVARLLRPGGVFSFVEISIPPNRYLRALYMFYVKRTIPLLGRILLGNPANYRLLGVYTEAFRDCGEFVGSLQRAGLEATFTRYFFGCATGVFGRKPSNRASGPASGGRAG